MENKDSILAIITTNPDKVGHGTPTFYCKAHEEMNKIASNLENILDSLAHELTEEIIIIVKH